MKFLDVDKDAPVRFLDRGEKCERCGLGGFQSAELVKNHRTGRHTPGVSSLSACDFRVATMALVARGLQPVSFTQGDSDLGNGFEVVRKNLSPGANTGRGHPSLVDALRCCGVALTEGPVFWHGTSGTAEHGYWADAQAVWLVQQLERMRTGPRSSTKKWNRLIKHLFWLRAHRPKDFEAALAGLRLGGPNGAYEVCAGNWSKKLPGTPR